MKISRPEDIHYLALEGGGGKGVTFLGAIKALESKAVLPIDIDKPGMNQIRGISGASAGAITALLLAMGATSTDIGNLLKKYNFNKFFDGPDKVGRYRVISRENKGTFREFVSDDRMGDLLKLSNTLISIVETKATLDHPILVLLLLWLVTRTDDPIIKKIKDDHRSYIKNLVFDGGIFPGIKVVQFFGEVIKEFLRERKSEFPDRYTTPINFKTFFRLTGIDLVVTGTNITKRKPGIFSRRHTPLFPVSYAMAISMNLPILFKPIYIDAHVPKGSLHTDIRDYYGFWVDGGLLNNFPLHAFDHLESKVSMETSKRFPDLRPLNSHMLGLRLTDGEPIQRPSVNLGKRGIHTFLADVLNSFMYPSEEGQILNSEERDQTINLYTYDLETVEFAPSEAKRAVPIEEAEKAVHEYFKP